MRLLQCGHLSGAIGVGVPLSKQDKLLLQEFAALFRSCAVCHWPESDMRRRMEIHHIIGGRGRKHDRRNLLSLCSACHQTFHSGSRLTGRVNVDKRILLTMKQETDPDYYDPEYLAYLLGKKHLGYDPAPLPQEYVGERQRNVKGWSSRNP